MAFVPVPCQFMAQGALYLPRLAAGSTNQPTSIWAVLWPVLIGAGATLGAVTLGALVEPAKLRFAHRAKIQQDRLVQCARLIEAATQTGARWNHIMTLARERPDQWTQPEVFRNDPASLELERHRADLYIAKRLLHMYGPREIASLAEEVAKADRAQYAQATRDSQLADALKTAVDDAIEKFADVAQSLTR